MTTIVYANGVMAADSRAYSGDKHPIGEKVKVRRMDDGTLLGASSTIVGGGERAMQWYMDGADPESDQLPKHFTLLVAKPDGSIFLADDTTCLAGPLTAPFIAVGSGEAYAHGALLFGACAVEAVRVACRADVWSGTPIWAVNHKSKNTWKVD